MIISSYPHLTMLVPLALYRLGTQKDKKLAVLSSRCRHKVINLLISRSFVARDGSEKKSVH